MPQLENIPFDEISVGQQATHQQTISEHHIELFAAASGDTNPIHLDADYAASTEFGQKIAHGMLSGAVVSAALALTLPGPGAIFVSQSMRFRLPVFIDDVITVTLTVSEKNDRRRLLTIDCTVTNQDGKKVLTGEAKVIAAADKLVVDQPEPPRFSRSDN